jgi:hypothetical protein
MWARSRRRREFIALRGRRRSSVAARGARAAGRAVRTPIVCEHALPARGIAAATQSVERLLAKTVLKSADVPSGTASFRGEQKCLSISCYPAGRVRPDFLHSR